MLDYIYKNGFIQEKKEKGEEDAPKFPELPKLPEFPEVKDVPNEPISQLPSFPNDSLSDKFSQNTIKEAVAGKKEVGRAETDEFEDEEVQMVQKPLAKDAGKMMPPKPEKTEAKEPIFIRIDRFEESSEIFEEIKKQISDIEKMSADVAKIKEKEDKELALWEEELKQIKEKIEKIDQNIFSKHE